MKYYRLTQVARNLNIKKDQVIKVLEQKEFNVENNPNSKISEKQLDILIENLAVGINSDYLWKDNLIYCKTNKWLSSNPTSQTKWLSCFYDNVSYKKWNSLNFENLYKKLLQVLYEPKANSLFPKTTPKENPFGFLAFSKRLKATLGSDYSSFIIPLPSFNKSSDRFSSAYNKKKVFDHTSESLISFISDKNIFELSEIYSPRKAATFKKENLPAAKTGNSFSNCLKDEEFQKEGCKDLSSQFKDLPSIESIKRFLKRLVRGFKINRTYFDLKSLIHNIIPPKLFYVFADEEDNGRVANQFVSFFMPNYHHAWEACLYPYLNIAFTKNERHKIFD